MPRLRSVVSVAVVLAVCVVIAVVAIALDADYRWKNRTWETSSPPSPDTLVDINRLTVVTKDGGEFDVTDASEIASFVGFTSQGTSVTMFKSGYRYRIRVYHRDGESLYYNHGGALGPKPGGSGQAIFVPAKPGFKEWFEELLARHGHPRRSGPATQNSD